VFNRTDIEAYGARDLADILRYVPGFELGVDVLSLVGTSFRGIWAYEGKILLMINGLTVNDYAYGNVLLIARSRRRSSSASRSSAVPAAPCTAASPRSPR